MRKITLQVNISSLYLENSQNKTDKSNLDFWNLDYSILDIGKYKEIESLPQTQMFNPYIFAASWGGASNLDNLI